MEIIYDDITEHYFDEIDKILSNKSTYYHSFDIPKRSGGKRHISEPLNELKHIQKILYSEIFYPKKYLIHKCAYAYVPGRSIDDCVNRHIGKHIVLKLDIKSFFSSITKNHIYDSFLYAFRMDEATAKNVTELCTFNGVLPQGAVTSPILSNYVCRILDKRLYEYCEKRHIAYSRYADDLIFSGDFDTDALLRYASWALRDYYDFKINYSKLKIMKSYQRQVVLGLSVNQCCRLTKEKRHEPRQTLYYIRKYGLNDFLTHTGCDLDSLKGYVNYAAHVSNEPDLCELQKLLFKQ